MNDAQAAAEGAYLDSLSFDKYKKPSFLAKTLKPLLSKDSALWKRGELFASAQNYARLLGEIPSNDLTPCKFASLLEEKARLFGPCIDIKIRSKEWIEEQRMGLFLDVSRGSVEEPKFVEIHYNPKDAAMVGAERLVLVGKGITFDSGGISIKLAAGMGAMKGDMGGAAVVAATIFRAASLGLKVPVTAIIPMCENMPDGRA
jgi:aminopeptidase